MRPLATAIHVLLSAGILVPSVADIQMGYQVPPAPLADLIEAPPPPVASQSPDDRWLLLMEYPALTSVAELAEPELRLGGLRIRPNNSSRSRARHISGLMLQRIGDGEGRTVGGIPAAARLGSPLWSPDSRHVAFTVIGDADVLLHVLDVSSGRVRQLSSQPLNAALGSPMEWLPDSTGLLVMAVPADRGDEPAASRVPRGPVVRETRGQLAPARTYQDLLKNEHDETLFTHYLTSRLMELSLDGKSRMVGPAGIIWSFEPSPDGKYVMVQTVHRPFSYLVPASRFPRRIEVWDRQGKLVRTLADVPLQEGVPIAFGSVPTGPRSFGWRSDAEATLHWVEAQDGGDAGREAEIRDRIFLLEAPFQGEPVALLDLSLRYAGIEWGNARLALVYEWWWKSRRIRTWTVAPSSPGAAGDILFDRSFEDRYGDPGDPVLRKTAAGREVLLTADGGKTLFLIGDGASPEGDRPFYDALDLKTRKARRLWRSEGPRYERPLAALDETGKMLLTRWESVDSPPNYGVRDLDGDDFRQLTDFPHPTPALRGLTKELIQYDRADGVTLNATLYLPPGHTRSQGRLPMLVWAYPREFKSADAAGQVSDSPYRFDRAGWWSPLLWLALGYAVLDDPTMPIIGEGEAEPNDTYVKQLVDSARAAVDEVVRRGIADPHRIAIGGHSYGAFMTANLLAHSDLFQAGIARSGAYNRTLTPFGFQAEERTVWQAPNIYFEMSPFMHADKINEPILLIHGDADNNSGTYPMQSERFYNALKGLGATARLAMLPHESHGYRARESILHMVWEMTEWLENYVKNAETGETSAVASREAERK